MKRDWKSRVPWPVLRLIGLCAVLAATCSSWAALAPYTPDANTIFLLHFDEPTGASVATNSAPLTMGTNLVAFDGNPFAGDGLDQPTLSTVLGASGFASFGNAADLSGGMDRGLGLDANTNGGFQLDDGAPISNDRLPTHLFFGVSNAFTLEALINVSSITGSNQEIIATDHGSGNADRGLQFRINPVGFLEFNFIGVSTTAVSNAIPTNGVHAFIAGEWFHVALTYDGANASFFWTRLSSGVTNANLIGGPVAEAVDMADDMLLVIGNEGRAVGATGSTEGLLGRIDEVRISNVARGSNEFVFRGVSIVAATGTQLPNVPENTLDGNLATRWSADGDGQHITYDIGRTELIESLDIAFYQPAGIRTNYFEVLVSPDGFAWRNVLTNTAATNAVLMNFDLADWPARYVRVVGHMNSLNTFNSITEVAIQSSPVVDADNDALPDVWEMFYFGNLAQTHSGDPDNDAQSNLFEYQRGTNPTEFNTPGDSDGDGMPDYWETLWFGNQNQTGTGDPDRDGFSNLLEYQNGSIPTNPGSVPGDTDGDALPDAWETANLGGLSYSAYEDPDSDSYNNTAEMVAGTNPLSAASKPDWQSPRVALLRDSVLAADACLMPSSATYGRAINGISFQKDNILVTFEGYQYTAWYDTVGTVQSVWLARRSVTNTSVGAWEKFNTGSQFLNGDETAWDAHNVIALGICPADGTLHVAWDHHNNTLRYRRSVAGLCTTNETAWGVAGMLNAEQNWLVASGQSEADVTYPQFTITPAGGLMMSRRIGSSGNGDQLFYSYNPISGGTGGNWSARTLFLSRTGTYNGSTSRCAYINGFDFGPDGKIHVTWTWREGAGTSNHDICYAYSTDSGVTWRNNVGTVIGDTSASQSISLNTAGITIKATDLNQLLINQQAQCVDADGRVHVLMAHRRQDSGYEYPNFTTAAYSTLAAAYYHYFRDPITGAWSQRRIPVDAYPVGSRPKIAYDNAGNLYAAFLSYPAGTAVFPGYSNGKLVIASASKISQFADWEVVQVIDMAFNGEPLLDQARLLKDNILSVYIQEHSANTSVVGTPLHVYDFVVGVNPPAPMSLNFAGPDSVVVLGAQAGRTYQLQSSPALTGPWSNVGVAVNGMNGLLALPDANGRAASQRFYRAIQTP